MKKSIIITTSIAVFGMSGLAVAKPGGHKGKEHFKALLEKYDEDGDGELSDDEKKAAKEAWIQKMKDKIDTDGDGEVSDEEKKAFRDKFSRGRRGGKKGGKEQLLEKFDADGAKYEERKAKHEERKAEFLEKYDTDGDGELSDAEKGAFKEEQKEAHEAFKSEMLQKYDEKAELLRNFDADNSGELEGAEREAAGDWLRENRPFFHGKGPRGKKSSHKGECKKGDKQEEVNEG